MKTISFRVDESFPLSAMEVRDVINSFWVANLQYADENLYEAWKRLNKDTFASMEKLYDWSKNRKNGG